MQQLKDILVFNGKWRDYQKRVLDNSNSYLHDKKVHIVAAPGSGKTTLGIELIRRVNAPCLILAPSVNIRDQWIARIRAAFVSVEPENLLSSTIKKPGMITVITYQALHSGMTRGKEEQNQEKEEQKQDTQLEEDALIKLPEKDDYSDFDFFATVKKAGIKTICLDEAHHLRSEWWKALEELTSKMKDTTLISLTATPPYDSTPAQWERYIGLCGPIDEEIIVPELVKEGSLCPHQDYVYFNMPTKEEEDMLNQFYQNAFLVADALFRDDTFTQMITTHKGLSAPSEYTDLFIQKPEYLSALLIFLQAKDIAFSDKLLKILGQGSRLPVMTLKWMEILLQGFLFDDTQSYQCPQAYIEEIKDKLKEYGLIQKRQICLSENEALSNLLMNSKGKINSILDIVRAEYENLSSNLRMLILTDYIKKESLNIVGDLNKNIDELGVVPIFENIRRCFSGDINEKNQTRDHRRITAGDLRIGVLSGSIVVIPSHAKKSFDEITEKLSVKSVCKEIPDTGFYQVTISGSEMTASGILTELFNQGEIRVLIGTKSLLGEGWDSPCINSLILASFVGSFMLSNQMRGRAIRVEKGNPDKVSNIWHLICMQSESTLQEKEKNSKVIAAEEETEDFVTLKRRFEGFLGVHYEKNRIENGLRRLSCIKPPFREPFIQKLNDEMIQRASDREGLAKRWKDTLDGLDKMEAVTQAGVATDLLTPGNSQILSYIGCAVSSVLCLFSLYKFFPAFMFVINKESIIWNSIKMIIWGALSCGLISYFAKTILQIIRTRNPIVYMQNIGKNILAALQKHGDIPLRDGKVMVENDTDEGMCYLYLKGVGEREKDLYAGCVSEFFGPVENPRYLLMAQGKTSKKQYYCVPEIFGKKKEDSEFFYSKVRKLIGKHSLIYTRSAGGKNSLLMAKLYSLANCNPDNVCKRKTVKCAD